jgi:hypothetical protein
MNTQIFSRKAKMNLQSKVLWLAFGMTLIFSGCGGGSTNTPPPPQSVAVSISSANGSVLLGNSQQFTASVTGSSNTSVAWSVEGVVGGNALVGIISSSGLYTAPGILPSPANVTVTATSQADSNKTASSPVTIASDILLSLQIPPSSSAVETNGTLKLNAILQSAGQPNENISWFVDGLPGGDGSLGTVNPTNTTSAVYNGPLVVPFPTTITLTAVSVADPGKSSSAIVTVMAPMTGVLLAAGQTNPTTWTNTAEVFNLAAGNWTPTLNVIPNSPPINFGGLCASNTALLGSGKVLLSGGGCSDKSITTNAASIYDPGTNEWTATNSMAFGRDQHGMVALNNGNAMVIAGCAGGCEGPNVLGQFFGTVSVSAEIYDAQTNSWGTVAPLHTVHGNVGQNNQLQGSVQLQDGRVLACGGSDANIIVIATCEIYTPQTNTWTTTGALSQPCEGVTCPLVLLANNNVLAVTRDGAGAILFDPAQGTWKPGGPLVSKQIGGTLTLLGNGKVLLTGGSTSITANPINIAEIYDPVTGAWRLTAPMTVSRLDHAALLLSNGKVLVAGGQGTGSTILSSAEIYDPSTETWTVAAPMSQPRSAAGVAGLH